MQNLSLINNILQKFYAGKRVLVTGGAGFIGSHLVDRLVGLGAKVTVVDNFSTGVMQNLQAALPKIKLIIDDIGKENTCKKVVQHQAVIFHLAAIASIPLCEISPQRCEEINVVATENLLKYASSDAKFVFSSSAAVYGNREGLCTEDQTPDPSSTYGSSKLAGEALCKKYAAEKNLQCTALRYFNVFGPRQENNPANSSVVVRFKQDLMRKAPLTIFGDGLQTRDFVHVFKVVEANLLLAACAQDNFAIFNVASGKSISLIELIELLEKQLQVTRTEIILKPARPGDIKRSEGACEKYRNFCLSLKEESL